MTMRGGGYLVLRVRRPRWSLLTHSTTIDEGDIEEHRIVCSFNHSNLLIFYENSPFTDLNRFPNQGNIT